MSCTKTQKKLCGELSCEICLERSCMSFGQEILEQWNDELKPIQVMKQSHRSLKFHCKTCNHKFEMKAYTVAKGGFCKFCANLAKCGKDDCKKCFESSCASLPERFLKCWDSSNKLEPKYVSIRTDTKKVIMNCDRCPHQFKIFPYDISRDRWCPFCCPNGKLCDEDDCDYCFKRSFASDPRSHYWLIEKNKLKPRQVPKSSLKKIWFQCNLCGEVFGQRLNNITHGNTWCGICHNKTELKFLKWFKSTFKDLILKNSAKFDWCKSPETNNFYIYDFVVEQKKIIIEIDGIEHFQEIKFWNTRFSFNERQERDLFKNDKAIQNGYTMIRVFKDDVVNDTNDWSTKIKDLILQEHDEPKLICLGDVYK